MNFTVCPPRRLPILELASRSVQNVRLLCYRFGSRWPMEASSVRAVLFVKDLVSAAAFYVGALGMNRKSGDKDHVLLECHGFELVVHQIPKEIAQTIVIAQPPIRRVWGAIRLDFPVASIDDSRRLARSLG